MNTGIVYAGAIEERREMGGSKENTSDFNITQLVNEARNARVGLADMSERRAFSGIRVTLPIDINMGVLTIASDPHVTEAIRKAIHFR